MAWGAWVWYCEVHVCVCLCVCVCVCVCVQGHKGRQGFHRLGALNWRALDMVRRQSYQRAERESVCVPPVTGGSCRLPIPQLS